MTDEDIANLLAKLTKSLATKEDINTVRQDLKEDIDSLKEDVVKVELRLGHKIETLETKLERKIEALNSKADTILEFAEGVDETASDHEKRLRRIETTSVTA